MGRKGGFSLADLVLESGKKDNDSIQGTIANIIEFIESDWGLGVSLYPVQKL